MVSVKPNTAYSYIDKGGNNGFLVNQKKATEPFVSVFKKWSWVVIITSGILQLLFFWSSENLFAVCCVWLMWWLTNKIVLSFSKISSFPLSTLILLGFSLTQYYLPIVFTLVEGKPMVYNLNVPYDVFTHSVLAYVVLLASHSLYTNNKTIRIILRSKIQSFLHNRSFFTPPSESQVWLIGLIGLSSMFISYFFIKQDYHNYSEGSGNKFLEALIPFTYAPYFLFLKEMYASDSEYKGSKAFYVKVIMFSILLFAVGVGGNARSLFIKGFVAAGIAYFLGLLLGRYNYEKIFKTKNVIILMVLFIVVTGPVADIATAMLVVRGQRGSISKTEMLISTLDVYKDKEALRAYKLAATQRVSEWDEHYFDNLFLARFCNIKYNDSSIEIANKIGRVDIDMRNYSIDRFWSIFPKPILEFLQVDIDKDKTTSSSFGDYLYMRSGGNNALGGFRTGQFAGTGMAAFGWWYLVILFVGIIPAYFLFDLNAIHKIRKNGGLVYINLIGLLTITSTFMFLSLSSTSESVINIFQFIIRGWLQFSLLYFLLFHLTKKITNIFK